MNTSLSRSCLAFLESTLGLSVANRGSAWRRGSLEQPLTTWSLVLAVGLSIGSAIAATGQEAVSPDATRNHDKNEASADPVVVHTVGAEDYATSEPKGTSSEIVSGPDGSIFSVSSAGEEGPIVIDLGWMPAEPGKEYSGRYRLRSDSLEDPANISLMIREHTAKKSRPLLPYHRTSVLDREVKPRRAEQWIDREFSFTTKENTRALSGAVVIGELKGTLHLSGFELLDITRYAEQARARAQMEYEKLMEEIRVQADARQRLAPRTLVFSRSQMKYGLERNYYHQWIDRPLFVNRDYRVPARYVTPFASYRRILEEVTKYDIDGLAFFPETSGRIGMFELHERAAREGIEGVGLLPEFLARYNKNDLEGKIEIVERAMKSPYAPRIDGKVLITSYGAASLTPAEWDEILTALRERLGDTFLFLPSLTNVVGLRRFADDEPISAAEIEEKQQYLRSWLDVCDGIYFNFAAALRNKDRTFDDAFYREIFIPVFKSVLNEPEYRNKYLGLSAYKSHMAPDRGNNLHEDGTRTLRRSFEAAMEAQPDVLILPEWDEFNENTCWRPTVYGSTTSQRIVRYYMSQIKDKQPTPVPGDDTAVPNLILSARKAVTLGEEVVVELLNVPDSVRSGRYTVEMALLDENGRLVRAFDSVTFDESRLQEERFRLATETVPDVRALVPVLKVRDYQGRDLAYENGFHHVQVRATWNWDYLFVKQPLRDLLRPESVEFSWDGPGGNGESLVLSGSVSSREPLAFVEVLGDDDEVYAVDPTDEFFRNDPDRELLLIKYQSNNDMEIEGALTLKKGTAEWLNQGTSLRPAKPDADTRADRVEFKSSVSPHQRWIYLAIPKGDVDDAVLDFDFDKARFSVPVSEVFERQMIGRAFENGLHFTVSPYRRQIDMPRHLNEKEVSFRLQVWPEITTEQYHLRLTTVSGKTFRTRPLLVPRAGDVAKKNLRVFSSRKQRGVDVEVAADRVPDLDYDFSPEHGAVLLTEAGRPFWATLGGFTSATTGRGTLNGFFYSGDQYPEWVESSAPAWTEDDGRPVLQFDGAGTYLKLPRESLPSRGPFTLEFEIKPDSDQDQSLLVTRVVGQQTGLALAIRDGKLHGSFRDKEWKTHRFATDLTVPADAWSTIRVRHDFETMFLGVDGRETHFPITSPAYNIGFTVMGDAWRDNAFSGQLRSFRIVHNAENSKTSEKTKKANAPHQTLPFDRFKVTFNGEPVASAEAPVTFVPGKLNRLTIAPLHDNTATQWQVQLRKHLPTGEQVEQNAPIDSSGGTTFLLGPLTAPPVYESESGEVYRRGYGLEIEVRETTGQELFRQSYNHGLAEGTMVYWRRGKEISAGAERFVPGKHERVVYNPGLGVESLLTLRLSEQVLRDPDDVEVQVRLNPGAKVETLVGQLQITDSNGTVLEQQEMRLSVGQWSSVPVNVKDWPEGNYRIAFSPKVKDRIWKEGPTIEYRRRTQPENQVSVSPFAPWTLERDPARPDVKISDFGEVVDSWTSQLGSWSLQTEKGRAALIAPVGKKAEPLALQTKLDGTYAVFARPYADGCLLQVGDDELIRPVRGGDLLFVTATDMTGGEVKLFSFDVYSDARAGLAELHFIPVTKESKEAFYRETSAPSVPLYGVNDWAEYFWGHVRLKPDQFVTILGGQAELGLRTIGWSIGRSWVEYESELPNTDPFPTVPLEEAAKTFERAPLYHGRTVMINEKRPLHHVLNNRERLGVKIWPWLSMNRHYGNQHGNMFSSRWFKENPQWRRWHKNASEPDASEVSYFFPEVRQERVDIFLEVAARGVDGLVVGACRQVPMLLYHPEMVATYQKKTGVNPQEIDASDGQVYRDWITWRADHFTQVLRMIKNGLAEIERQQGRDIQVAVRVPTVGLFYNLAQGLDIEQWCREGLVDQIQLVPLETCGGRGTHDIQPYLDLGREHGVTMIGGIGANWMNDQGTVPALYRALDLIDTGVAGIEFYESEMLARTSHIRWLMPVFGNKPRIKSMLRDSNLEACFPITANNAMFGFDNHAKWASWGYSVHDDSPNAL